MTTQGSVQPQENKFGPVLDSSVTLKQVQERMDHVDSLFHTRINFLIASEALLFAGLARLIGEKSDLRSIVASICAAGAVLTFLIFASLLNLSRKLRWLQQECARLDAPFYGKYRGVRLLPWLDTLFLYTWVLPPAFLMLWILAAIYFTL